MQFFPNDELMQRQINILLVGTGGTGSEVLSGLARLHYAMVATGHEYGLNVVAIDGDNVSAANIGRQPFCPSDIGQNKAIALVTRYNLHYGLRWTARPYALPFDQALLQADFDILITCVDVASVRVKIAKYFRKSKNHRDTLWLDCGNGLSSAQVVCGHLTGLTPTKGGIRLPNIFNLYPELNSVADDNEPSCSVAQALQRQDLFINRMCADLALQILNRLLRHGRIEQHGVFIDLEKLIMKPIDIDPIAWRCLGYSSESMD